ncbi:MAG TPA: protein kinase [Vicinamibacteria bacterium]|nr:protein kinase [Vicinamibacteria bacterium]
MSEQRVPVPEPSEIAGRYLVVKKLGAGAFGTVYKAKDKILGRMVAIKTIRLEGLAAAGTSLDELMDRFKREAQVSAQLKHPNIVTIYDVGEAGGMSYIAMEFIDGMGLDRVIATAGRLPLDRAAGLAAQVADALDFAHRNNVVHRDIKPANIMVEPGDRVKVTDFGIAKVTDSGDHLTVTGSLLGTPSYMSPEQARGALLDGRSDLFAVGAVLYEMLAGKKAFRGDSITGLIFKIITEEPPPIRELDPSVPDEMVRILAKGLAKTPDARYQTGRDLADDLLALTRAGSSPTLRQSELATAPAMRAPGAPAGGSPPTLHSAAPATLNEPVTPTVVAGGPPRGVAPAAEAATRVSPPPPARGRPPARSGPPVVSAPAPRKSNAGLLAGLAVGALVLLVGVGAGAWMLLGRRPPPQTGASGTLGGTAGASGSGTEAAPPSTMAMPAEPAAVPEGATVADAGGPGAGAPPATVPPANPTRAPERTSGGPVRTASAERAAADPSASGAAAPAAAPPVAPAAPPPARFRYLDEEPQGDGREAGERAADAYRGRQGRSSSSGGFGTSRRFAQRERSPRDLAPAERPAVATLRYLIDRQEAYKKGAGKYGTFGEIAKASGFAMDVPVTATSFQRRGYRFDLTVEEDAFRITAVPVGPGNRPFLGDDTGFIRAGLE